MNAQPDLADPAETAAPIPSDAALATDALAAAMAATAAATPPEVGEIQTLQGRKLRFSVSVDPVIDLDRGAVAGHRIEPKISYDDTREPLSPADRRQLLPRDIQQVDIATLERGLSRLEGGESTVARASLIISLSFLTVSSTRARTALIEAATRARGPLSASAIFEITDFDAGLPASRLREACQLMKPFCRSVFAHDVAGSSVGREVRAIGLTGLVYQSPAGLARSEDEAVWLLQVGRGLDGKSGARVAVNLSTSQLLPMAAAAGFTHATVRAK